MGKPLVSLSWTNVLTLLVMIKELWRLFPRLLEQRINALLDEAEPNSMKAFQLYKTCQNEGLWQDTFDKFSENIKSFFSLPKAERGKSDLDAFLNRPMDTDLYENFHLNFRTALVNSNNLDSLASWAHNMMRVNSQSNSMVISIDVLKKALHDLTHPTLFEKAQDFEFDDFCTVWKKTVAKLFGRKYNPEFNEILKQVNWLNEQLKSPNPETNPPAFFSSIYLTQTEIDWTLAVKKAVQDNLAVPKFPLSRGPQKQRLIDLERAVCLYRIVQTTLLPELMEHRNNIRVTILDRCQGLLRDKAS